MTNHRALVEALANALRRMAPTFDWEHGCIDLDVLASVVEDYWQSTRIAERHPAPPTEGPNT